MSYCSGAQITAADVNAMVGSAIDQIPASMLSPAAKGTLRWRLFAELFGELGLNYSHSGNRSPSSISSISQSDQKSWSLGVRSGVGVILYFGS